MAGDHGRHEAVLFWYVSSGGLGSASNYIISGQPEGPPRSRTLAFHFHTMLGDDEDVFDSVTWESPATHVFDIDEHPPTGPGFRQSTVDSEGPHDPKWEGYLITSVKDPVKELAETKDAYVSYLVQARVCYSVSSCLYFSFNVLLDKPPNILYPKSFIPTSLPRLCFPQGQPCQGLSSLCCPSIARQTPIRFVSHLSRMNNYSPISEYITGDRFSPEFMERRRLE